MTVPGSSSNGTGSHELSPLRCPLQTRSKIWASSTTFSETHRQVRPSVRVEIMGGQGDHVASGLKRHFRLKRAVAVAERERSFNRSAAVTDDQVGSAIGVEIVNDDGVGSEIRGQKNRFVESSVSAANKDGDVHGEVFAVCRRRSLPRPSRSPRVRPDRRAALDRKGPPRGDDDHLPVRYAITLSITCPCTSVKRRSMPLWR